MVYLLQDLRPVSYVKTPKFSVVIIYKKCRICVRNNIFMEEK
jgi:hypothetical protein